MPLSLLLVLKLKIRYWEILIRYRYTVISGFFISFLVGYFLHHVIYEGGTVEEKRKKKYK